MEFSLDTEILNQLARRHPALLDPTRHLVDAAVISDLLFYMRLRAEWSKPVEVGTGINQPKESIK
jgi:hypothetical protein